MIKLVFSDLDGTLLYRGKENPSGVSCENLKAIELLKENNIHFAIATGRHHTFLPKILNTADTYFDTVGQGGAQVLLNNELLYCTEFELNEIKEILHAFKGFESDGSLIMTTRDNDFVYDSLDSKFIKGFQTYNPELPRDYSTIYDITIAQYIEDLTNEKPSRVCCHFDDQEKCDEYRMLLNEKFKDRYSLVKSSPHSFEILKDGANKGKGIFLIAQHLNIDLSEIACIGDSENDLEMFDLLLNSYCMSHSKDEIKSRAKYTVDSVHEAIQDIIEKNNKEKTIDN